MACSTRANQQAQNKLIKESDVAEVENIDNKIYISGFEGEKCPKCGCDKLEVLDIASFRCMKFECRHQWRESMFRFSEVQDPNKF